MREITTRQELIHHLTEAAALEHGIICQYLFAAFSLKMHPDEGHVTWPQLERIRQWKSELLRIARQEMEHHGLVCNLLTAIGGTPHFRRAPFPHLMRYCPPYPQFELQRFGEAALQRFACFEKLHVVHTEAPDLNVAASSAEVTIGRLYQQIRQGFEHVKEQNALLFIGPNERQITNHTLGLPAGHFDINIVETVDLDSALSAIDQIIGAGQPPQGHHHHAIFTNMLHELEGMRRTPSTFEPARPVVPNPLTRTDNDPVAEVTTIVHPATRHAAELFNLAYETMTLMLMRLYDRVDTTDTEWHGLMKTAFFPLMTAVIRPLGELLTQMPVADDPAQGTAGPSFEFYHDLSLSSYRHSAWVLLHERLQSLGPSCERLCQRIAGTDAPWARQIEPRLHFLHENMVQIAENFAWYMNLKQAHVEHLLKRLL